MSDATLVQTGKSLGDLRSQLKLQTSCEWRSAGRTIGHEGVQRAAAEVSHHDRRADLRKHERAEQLEVRWKLIRAVRAALSSFGKAWTKLPKGVEDWSILDAQCC